MRRSVSLVVIATIAALTVPAAAGGRTRIHSRRIAPLRLTLTAGIARTVCTRPVPDSWSAAVWVYANGHDLHSASAGGWTMYYAGNGTLVRLTSYQHGGPVCARAITWKRWTRVLIAFRVL